MKVGSSQLALECRSIWTTSLYWPEFLFPPVEREGECGTGWEVSCPSGPLCCRFQCVFPVLPPCLSPQAPLPSVLLTVGLLSLLVDHEKLVSQLCSHSGKAGRAGIWTPAGWREGWQQGRGLLQLVLALGEK